jgi:hypothetical protein
MSKNSSRRVAIVYHGDLAAKQNATPANSKVPTIFPALAALGIDARPVVYNDDFRDEVRRQLLGCDGVLVWVNPVEQGRDRSLLDALLREVAAAGVFVSAHPDVILKLGTKEVLYTTRDLGWGCDTHMYASIEQMREALPARLAAGEVRVLKQYRGQSGDGVWKVERADSVHGSVVAAAGMQVRARHAKRGAVEEQMPLHEFFARCAPYFKGDGRMIDQIYQPRLPEGMVRCYLTHGEVGGFGLQAINALYPAPAGAPAQAAPQPGPRLYYPATLPEYQALKRQLEQEWVPAMQRLLGIETRELPVLWDCDFLRGPKTSRGEDTFVLCEINASSVSPFPDSALSLVARATLARVNPGS